MSDISITVPFYGQSLCLLSHNNEPYTAMKPIVEGMGLAWQGQHAKLRSNQKRWGIKEILIPSNGGNQETLCIPVRKLPGWLMTIHPNKVKPEIREKVIAYQNECDDVLWEYWNKQIDAFKQGPLTEEMQEGLNRLIKNGAKRLPFEKQTAAVFKQWNDLSDHFGVPYKDIPAERYPEVVSLVTRLQSEWELVDEPVPSVIPQHEDSHYRNVMALCSMAMLSFERWPLISGALYQLNRDLAAKISTPILEGDILARMVLKQFRKEIESAQSEEFPCNQRRDTPAMRFLVEMR